VPNWENAQQEWDAILRKFDRRAPVGTPEHTHDHPHDIEGELQGELRAEIEFRDRPPTYISTLDIPALVHPTSVVPVQSSVDQAREEENLRQAYASLVAWMEGVPKTGIPGSISGNALGVPPISPTEPSPITPITPHSSSPHIPSLLPCPLDRKPYIDVHTVPVSQYMCFACGNPSDGSDLKTCSGCRRTKYCDEVW
jgi:hypothetical protein